MAFWPGYGSTLTGIDYSRMTVGVVQYFIKHTISLKDVANDIEHVFAYVKWKKKHEEVDYYGISASVCVNDCEPYSICNFIPVQRIAAKCAFCLIKLKCRNGIEELVFVACPVPIKFSIA